LSADESKKYPTTETISQFKIQNNLTIPPSSNKICLQVLPTYFGNHYTFQLLDADIIGTENKT